VSAATLRFWRRYPPSPPLEIPLQPVACDKLEANKIASFSITRTRTIYLRMRRAVTRLTFRVHSGPLVLSTTSRSKSSERTLQRFNEGAATR
jgi:hypothetical protein